MGRGANLPTLKMEKKYTFTIEIEYSDESNFMFDVILTGPEYEIEAELMKITRGTLMVSSAYKATAYRQDGFPVLSYINR